MHIGRSWGGGGHLEAACPCPLEPCGLVDRDKVVDECDQHSPMACKTMRTGHRPEDCPGVGRDVVVAIGRTETARSTVIDAASMEEAGYVNLFLLDALDDYRAAVEHEAAERIRMFPETPAGHAADWWDAATIPDAIVNEIDPETAS
ncbi:hypothetical protein [Streptomyces sp. SID5910]|uniref:hypothetical protein n=1 Tax=Streptomyces sp. SID5910 TaxID=2690312 RepID=UPI0013AA786D|nr:hypothetical protein [Streptomyces sp. SID5910]MYR43089.1 hypothetical protein [Streptomyces sp. SID5910]